MLYIITFFALIIIILTYIRIAKYSNILDRPNSRSSHQYITVRGGGIIFPVAAFLWFFLYGYSAPWIIAALFFIATISFIDDLIPLSSSIRILVQLIATTVLFWQLQLLGIPWYVLTLIYIITLGWINAFNFMDGINGLTGIYGLVALGTFLWLNKSIHFVSSQLLVALILSLIIFLFFNFRKRAKTFAGDVGSISLAFLLSWFIISLIQKTGQLGYILCFAVYGIDSVVTILMRLARRENIFKAHRTHLYQFLSNEYKWSHIKVSLIYGFIQCVINIIVIQLIANNHMNHIVLLFFVSVLSAGYLVLRYKIQKAINWKYSY
ncbi:glycosyltransferase family 4 protein [Prolixibacteraceae bacterium Z1-6]|uniref:Glycosyltransferase family 4 protein n=1 Tax=Draconibacterium aestuarii TaxID=2998507 RepID=A0A9X3F9Y9_9BACT|nr:glycosyltransferase family 4 protein [Prolixibacteraceae bacterium Z1-6]